MPRAPTNFFPGWADTERTRARFDGDPEALATDLRRRLRGEVRFDGAYQALYSTDASNYRQVPLGVVLPRDTDDLVEAVAVCRAHGAPITHRGGGTSIGGQCLSTGVVIDGSKYLTRILEVDPEGRRARVEPGVVLDRLQERAEAHHLTYGPDPSTHAWCTLGGMLGNNACGMHSQMAGRTEDNVEAMEVLTYDGLRLRVGPTPEDELERIVREGGRRGEIYRRLRDLRDRYADEIRARYPDLPRRVSGYNLPELLPERGFHLARALVGTEGTCVTILEATVRLCPSPPERALLVLGYPDVCEAGHHVAEIGEMGAIGLEGLDDKLLDYLRQKGLHSEHLDLFPEGGGFLIAEFGGDARAEALDRARACMDAIERRADGRAPTMRLYDDPADREHVLEMREAGLGATAHTEGESWEGWEDSAVPPEHLGDYLRDLRRLYDKYGYDAALYGHFGQGCVHTRINFDLESEAGIATFRAFLDEASDLCLRYGGSLSGEHGDGQSRAELLPKMYGEALTEAFRAFKAIWDPEWKMNPGKVVDPYRVDQNLRLGPGYDPPEPETYFAFPDDHGSFASAALRCVGVGQCRRTAFGPEDVMCPSYLATRDEMHTTRGRARLLFEMLNGETTPAAWRNDDVHEALDLCLACKGCKRDCPVHVDMATYKAEFLAHYYEGRLRPRAAYAMGLIPWWARLASAAPRLANLATQAPGLGRLAKLAGGIAPERTMPAFAEQTFKAWFARRGAPPAGEDRPRVMLWPDTFTNHFEPHIGRAAVEVLEDAGFRVVVPEPWLCCGRPLYDYGFLDRARRLWLRTLDALGDEIEAGTPLVGLEPSCVAGFRDELVSFFPDRDDARRLSRRTFTLAEFLTREAEGYAPPRLEARALVHGHCHHKAVMGFETEAELLERMGLDVEVVASGCCGMAGSFGFEAGHYDVSMACGEYALLPAAREAGDDVLLVADGFSCRHQVAEGAGRRPLHLAEVLHLALGGQTSATSTNDHAASDRPPRCSARIALAAGALVAGAAAGVLAGRS